MTGNVSHYIVNHLTSLTGLVQVQLIDDDPETEKIQNIMTGTFSETVITERKTFNDKKGVDEIPFL